MSAKLSGRHTYRLVHSGRDGRLRRDTEFEAVDAACALFEAQRFIPAECTISINEDGKALGNVNLALEGFWTVSRSPVLPSK